MGVVWRTSKGGYALVKISFNELGEDGEEPEEATNAPSKGESMVIEANKVV